MKNESPINFYHEIYSIVDDKTFDDSQINILDFLDTDFFLKYFTFCNTTSKINFFFNLLFSSKNDKIKSFFKNFIESHSLKGNRIQMEIVIFSIIIGTYDINSKNKLEFIDYLSVILGLDKVKFEHNYDNFVKNFNQVLSFKNIYFSHTDLPSFQETVKDLNIQVSILELFSKKYLNSSDNIMIIIIIKYIKVILRLYFTKGSSFSDTTEKHLLYLIVKFCFFNKFEVLDYSLDLVNFILEKFIEGNITNSYLSNIFFMNFTPCFLEKLLELNSSDSSKKENDLVEEFRTYILSERLNSNLFSRDICIFYFVYLYNNKIQNIIKQKENKEIETKNFSNFPPLFYKNFKLYDMYNFILKNQSSLELKDNLMKSVMNLILIMYSEIMKYNLPFDFPCIQYSDRFIELDSCEYEDISDLVSILECEYIPNKIFKIVIFKFLINHLKVLISNSNNYNQEYNVRIWKKIYYHNPIMSSMITLSILTEKNINKLIQVKDFPLLVEDKMNQIKLFNFNKVIDDIYLQKDFLRNDKIITVIIFDCVKIIIFLYNYQLSFNRHYLIASFQGNTDLFHLKYISNLVLAIYELKNINKLVYKSHLKSDINKLFHSIILNNNECISYIIINCFDEKLVKFLLKNVESSHISFNYSEELINSNDPIKIVNGLLLIGHWSVTYPLKYTYTRILDILNILKSFNMKKIFINEENSIKFFKAIYLFTKAYPKISEEIMSFLNFIRKNLANITSELNLPPSMLKKMLDNTVVFIEKVLINSDYYNKQTLNINLKKQV